MIDINLNGTFNMVRLAAEAIARSEPQEDGLRGVLVMTSSVSAFDGQIGQASYSASKGGVASLTLPLAREFGQHGIRVVSIAPGIFETPMMQAAPDKVRQSLVEQIPFPKRFGHAEEFASFVCHIFREQHAQRLRAAVRRCGSFGSRSSRRHLAVSRTRKSSLECIPCKHISARRSESAMKYRAAASLVRLLCVSS